MKPVLPSLILFAFFPTIFPASANVSLVEDGKSLTAIYVPSRVMEADQDLAKIPALSPQRSSELNRQRLRDSVNDLKKYLGQISGAEIEIVSGETAALHGKTVIFIGELAERRFGPVGKSTPGEQAFRYVVNPSGIGLYGESDLASSYAIYELLDRLGCRWYLPGDLGEVIPDAKSIHLDDTDLALGPGTLTREIWHADNAYRRRNRLGGMTLATHHALEGYLTMEDRAQHPDYRAEYNGEPLKRRLKWSNPRVVKAVADKIEADLDKIPRASISLSPEDGATFDNSEEERRMDAGDFDSTFQEVAITDRLLAFSNQIVERVTKKHPDVLFGLLAYVQYTRPPLRERPHPNLIPQIAPITYDRAHPITDQAAPGNKELAAILKGWAKVAPRISYYPYAYFLAELSAPYPLIRKWSKDLPLFYENNCVFWQPETTTNFETTLHGLYLGNRLAWNPKQKPEDIINELNERFYGHAGREMAAYWDYIDRVWVDTPEYTGGDFGYLLRFTPEVMKKARELMNAGVAACRSPMESERVELANASLRQFESYMKLREDYSAGRFVNLATDNANYRQTALSLAKKYKPNFAFSAVSWAKDTHALAMHDLFKGPSYEDASRIAKQFEIITPKPLTFKFCADRNRESGKLGWHQTAFDDSAWKETNPAVETWSSIGLHSYFGSVGYRTSLNLPVTAAGKKIFLWFGGTDGTVEVFVNGKPIQYIDLKTGKEVVFSGFCQPVSFDITEAVKGGEQNIVFVRCNRDFLNEVGTGGLLGPVVIYREK